MYQVQIDNQWINVPAEVMRCALRGEYLESPDKDQVEQYLDDDMYSIESGTHALLAETYQVRYIND